MDIFLYSSTNMKWVLALNMLDSPLLYWVHKNLTSALMKHN